MVKEISAICNLLTDKVRISVWKNNYTQSFFTCVINKELLLSITSLVDGSIIRQMHRRSVDGIQHYMINAKVE